MVNTGEAKSIKPTARHVNYTRPGTYSVDYKCFSNFVETAAR